MEFLTVADCLTPGKPLGVPVGRKLGLSGAQTGTETLAPSFWTSRGYQVPTKEGRGRPKGLTLYATRYRDRLQANEGEVTPAEVAHGETGAMGALGQSMVEMVESLYGGYQSVEPLVSFVGDHPFLAFSAAMLAVLLGGAVGGYIGAGARTT